MHGRLYHCMANPRRVLQQQWCQVIGCLRNCIICGLSSCKAISMHGQQVHA